MRRVRLVIADRRPIVLQGFASLFAAQADFEIVASCLDGASCLEAIRKLTPDVALVEDGFSDVTAPQMLAVVNAENLPTRLVLYTASVARGDLAAAIAAGACSAISMRERPETLLQSLRLVAARPDQARVRNEKNGAFVENALAVLTDEEREIMRRVALGLSNKAIARQLNVSPGAIKVRLKHMFEKLEINNRSELAALALSLRYGGIGVLAAVIFAAMEDGQPTSLNSVDGGHVVTDTFTVTAADGTAEVVTITINRSKESAGASGIMARAAIKTRSAANAAAKTPISSSNLVDSSVDITGSTFTSVASNAPRPNLSTYGTFMTAAVAVWIYLIDIIHSAAKALDLGDSLADVSASAAANGTTELATLTVASSAAASPDSYDNPASPNSSRHDWSFAFGTPRDDATLFGDKLRIIDANAEQDIVSGKDHSPPAASTDADTIHGGSTTVNAFAGRTIDHGSFGEPTTADASQHFEHNTKPSTGDDPDRGQSQHDLPASAEAAKQHAKHDVPSDDSNPGQSQRDLHASEHGSEAAEQHAKHHATPGGASPGHDPHASQDHSAAAKQHANHHAPGHDSNPGQSQRDFHASEDSSATAEQHAKQDAKPESDVNPGHSQRNLHAAPANASNNPHSESTLNAGGKDHATGDAGHAQTPAAPQVGDSFHFKTEMAASKAPDIFEAHAGPGPASTEHGQHADQHDGLTPIQDTGLTSLSLAEQNNFDHAKCAEHHLTHYLIV